MSKFFSRRWKRAILILSIVYLGSIGTACFKPRPTIYIPIEKDIVQKLENGNWEVRPGLIYDYFRTLAENKLLKIRIAELEKK